jgi:uncharacterized membrane protein YfcA
MQIIVLFLIGSLGGLLAGLLGVGGGLIFIPVIEHYLKPYHLSSTENVKYILANSIAIVFASGLSGIYRQIKMGSWQWRSSLLIGIPGAIASFFATYAIKHGNWYYKSDFQWVFLGFLLISIANMIWGKSNNPSPLEPTSAIKENVWKTITIGIFAGITVSLSGLGGGIVMVPLFRILLNKPMKDATALSLSIVPMLAIASLANYSFTNPLEIIGSNLNPYNSPWQLGYLYFPIILPMIIATFITTSFAQKNAKYVPVVWLRIIFALLSSTIFIKTLIEIYKS